MLYTVAAALMILWALGLENNRHFGFLTYGLMALGLLIVTASLLEKRGQMVRVKRDGADTDRP